MSEVTYGGTRSPASSSGGGGDATAANQTTIIGHIDGIEGILTTMDADTGNIATSTASTATNTTDIPNVIGTDGSTGPTKAVSVGGTDSSGNLQEIRTDTDGELQVDVVSSALPSGAATAVNQSTEITALQIQDNVVKVDDAAFTPATDSVSVAGFVVDDTTTDTLDEGDAGAARIDASRRQLMRIVGATDANRADVDASGHLQVDLAAASTSVTVADGGGSLTVDNNGTFVIQENGAALTALQLIDDTVFTDDAAFTPASSKVNAIGCFVNDTATDSVNEGDIGAPRMSADRVLYAQGAVAHDAADSGNPVKVGFKAYAFDGTAPQTAAAEADRVNGISDLQGIQYVQISHPFFWHVSADYASAQTNTSVKAAPGAGLALYITDISISNGATAGNITLLDGSGGTVLYELYPAINGGAVLNLRNPIKLTANTALVITSTTVTTHSVFVAGFTVP